MSVAVPIAVPIAVPGAVPVVVPVVVPVAVPVAVLFAACLANADCGTLVEELIKRLANGPLNLFWNGSDLPAAPLPGKCALGASWGVLVQSVVPLGALSSAHRLSSSIYLHETKNNPIVASSGKIVLPERNPNRSMQVTDRRGSGTC